MKIRIKALDMIQQLALNWNLVSSSWSSKHELTIVQFYFTSGAVFFFGSTSNSTGGVEVD